MLKKNIITAIPLKRIEDIGSRNTKGELVTRLTYTSIRLSGILFFKNMIWAKNLLKQGAFWQVNKTLVKAFEIEAAFLLTEIIDLYFYFEARDMLIEKEGKLWFYCTSDQIKENTLLTYKKQKTCLQTLEKVVETKLFGLPAKQHYCLDFGKIFEIINGNCKTSIAFSAKLELLESENLNCEKVKTLNNNRYNNNRDNNNRDIEKPSLTTCENSAPPLFSDLQDKEKSILEERRIKALTKNKKEEQVLERRIKALTKNKKEEQEYNEINDLHVKNNESNPLSYEQKLAVLSEFIFSVIITAKDKDNAALLPNLAKSSVFKEKMLELCESDVWQRKTITALELQAKRLAPFESDTEFCIELVNTALWGNQSKGTKYESLVYPSTSGKFIERQKINKERGQPSQSANTISRHFTFNSKTIVIEDIQKKELRHCNSFEFFIDSEGKELFLSHFGVYLNPDDDLEKVIDVAKINKVRHLRGYINKYVI